MIKKLFLFLIVVSTTSVAANAGDKIKFYFNHSVDNSVSTGENAIFLNDAIADTLVSYINRAHYTIDVAVYDFISGSFADIASAMNNAYSRGVKIRWIYDGSSSNAGISDLNSAINTLASPTSSDYTIMHNKFMIVDAYSPDPADAIVWTGSTNWDQEQLDLDYNNVVIIQDSALAHAYTDEFNLMWGGTGIAPDLSLSKFGSHKTDLGRHNFTIEGHNVELYFSPSDNTNSKIQGAISSANTDLYFGVYTFTDKSDANLIMSQNTAGVYVAGIIDVFSKSYAPYSIFKSGLGSRFITYSGSGIYHNKFMIVDPSNVCSDPLVLTGSHNWSISADTKNDENTLIIHSDTAANIYYQSFKANFTSLGGSISPVIGCTLGVPLNSREDRKSLLYPNPSDGNVNFSYKLSSPQNVSITIYNTIGQEIASLTNNEIQQAGDHSLNYFFSNAGIYLVRFIAGNEVYTNKLVIQN